MGSEGEAPDDEDQTTFSDPLNLSRIDQGWQLPPLDSRNVIRKLGKENRDVSHHICNVLGKSPLCIKLKKKAVGVRGSPGGPGSRAAPVKKFRAQVTLGSGSQKDLSRAKKLRSVWSVRTNTGEDGSNTSSRAVGMRSTSKEVLEKSYEEYVGGLYPSFDLEVILPKTGKAKRNGSGNPVILYSAPVAPGSTQEGSRVSQSKGVVTVFPNGRKRGGDDKGIEVGQTSFHVHGGPSVVDGHLARGRKFFWKGRDVGQM